MQGKPGTEISTLRTEHPDEVMDYTKRLLVGESDLIKPEAHIFAVRAVTEAIPDIKLDPIRSFDLNKRKRGKKPETMCFVFPQTPALQKEFADILRKWHVPVAGTIDNFHMSPYGVGAQINKVDSHSHNNQRSPARVQSVGFITSWRIRKLFDKLIFGQK